jgi:hypothetical protein
MPEINTISNDRMESFIETTVRFSATYQSTITSKLPDPEQPEFPNL